MVRHLLRDCVRGFGILVSDVVICGIFFCQFPIMSGRGGLWIHTGVWCLFLLALFLGDRLLVYREIPVNFYIAWNLAAVAAGAWYVTAHSLGEGWKAFPWLLAGAAALTGAHSAWLSFRLPGANGIQRYVDALIVILGFYLYEIWWMEEGRAGQISALPANQGAPGFLGTDMTRLIPLLAMGAIVLNLTAVNQIRTKDEGAAVIQGSGAGGRAVLVLSGGAVVGAAAAVVGLASGKVHNAVDLFLWLMGYVLKAVELVMTLFAMAVGYVIYFFIMLMPNGPAGMQNSGLYVQKQEIIEKVENAVIQVPDWVAGALLALAAIAGLIWVFRRFRGMKLKGAGPLRAEKAIVRKSYVLEALLTLAGRMRDGILFEFRYRRNRNTLEGMLVYAERLGKRRKVSRQTGEGPGEYMRRLAARLEAGENRQREELFRLAHRLDCVCYGGGEHSLRGEDCRNYMKIIAAASKTSRVDRKER